MADLLEHEKRQMKDQASALLRRELTVKARRPMGLRAPELYLIWIHVGSPGLRRWQERHRDATEHRPAGGCATSPAKMPPKRSQEKKAGRRAIADPSRPREYTNECRPAEPRPDGAAPFVLVDRKLREPYRPARDADV